MNRLLRQTLSSDFPVSRTKILTIPLMPAVRLDFQKSTSFRLVLDKVPLRRRWRSPIPKHVKAERGKAISELEIELRREYFERLVGKELTLLAERYDTQTATLSGTSCRYAPVVIESSKDDADVLDGQLVARMRRRCPRRICLRTPNKGGTRRLQNRLTRYRRQIVTPELGGFATTHQGFGELDPTYVKNAG